MITQYTRLFLDAGGKVKHCHSQTLPFNDNFDPVQDPGIASFVDVEIDTDFESIGEILTADKIIKSVEVKNGKPTVKPNADKILGKIRKKAINESAVNLEIETAIDGMGLKNGTIKEFKRRGIQISKLSDLNSYTLVKLKREIDKQVKDKGNAGDLFKPPPNRRKPPNLT